MKDYHLTFSQSVDLIGYMDADWASQAHQYLISGYIFLVGGGTISWSSCKQLIIALSSTEAKYIAASNSCQELLWLRAFISEITSPIIHLLMLYCNNQSAIASAITIASSGLIHTRTKHIDIQYHFIHKVTDSKLVNLTYCSTNEMAANILTKALPCQKIQALSKLIGLHSA